MHYFIEDPNCSVFRTVNVNILGVPVIRSFRVMF